ncbi:hypothetical protein CDD81_1714 [Ophiocordyceps australis]|uniref:Uncharacterized protein n=1 Tax=Ophiocordyceps australis TaxID=1399860 RepID=A0A2C5XKD4_9HYPO|nr:hypothetical protein CDD81_1714 [Ophiocordyceps australis]
MAAVRARGVGSGSLGLGWLIAVALGSAAAVFGCVGLILAWRVRRRQGAVTSARLQGSNTRALTTRLTKRRRVKVEVEEEDDDDDDDDEDEDEHGEEHDGEGQEHGRRREQRDAGPPVLPPLPTMQTYSSFNFFRAPSRTRLNKSIDWSEEERRERGIRELERARDRERRFSRDNWFGSRLKTVRSPERGEVTPSAAQMQKQKSVQGLIQYQRQHGVPPGRMPQRPIEGGRHPHQMPPHQISPLHHHHQRPPQHPRHPHQRPPPQHQRPPQRPPLQPKQMAVPQHEKGPQSCQHQMAPQNEKGPRHHEKPLPQYPEIPRAQSQPSHLARTDAQQKMHILSTMSAPPQPAAAPAAASAGATTGTTATASSSAVVDSRWAPQLGPRRLTDGPMIKPASSQAKSAVDSQGRRPKLHSSATDSDLRDILRSTDERLRFGHSPPKTTRSSPVRNGQKSPKWPSTSGCASSRLAGPDDLAPGGLGLARPLTPSNSDKSPQEAWQSHLSPQHVPQLGVGSERPLSGESDVSSSLSTLYSVGEPDDDIKRPADDDPFVDQNKSQRVSAWGPERLLLHPKPQPWGPRPLRSTKTSSIPVATPSMSPQQLARPVSAYPLYALARGPAPTPGADPIRWPVVLQPPLRQMHHQLDPVRPDSKETGTPSESSFTSESVDDRSLTDDTDVPGGQTPKPIVPPRASKRNEVVRERSAHDAGGGQRATETRARRASSGTQGAESVASDVSSSPYNEHDLMCMLMSNSSPKRALPQPPGAVVAPDGTLIPTPLTPRPRERPASTSETDSWYSSTYGMAAPSSGSPSRRPTVRSNKTQIAGQAAGLGNAIAELRRMNSLVSTYSAASMTSTAVGGQVADSPTLPSIFAVNPTPTGRPAAPRPGAIGSRHYLSIGQGNATAASRHCLAQSKTMASLDAASSPTLSEKEHPQGEGKENQGHAAVRSPRGPEGGAVGLRETPRRENRSLAPTPQSPPEAILAAQRLRRVLPGVELTAEERRSIDSLGMYDKDGFLIPSPDREGGGRRCLRM